MAKRKAAEEIPVFCSHDEMVHLDKLVPHPRNPNTHPPEQVELLAKIIRMRGWRLPITVSKRSGLIIRGHARVLAAQRLEAKLVPVDYQDYESEEEEQADLIADNRLAELADMDDLLLKPLLADLQKLRLDMDLTGFDEIALMEMFAQKAGEDWRDSHYEADNLPEAEVSGKDTRTGRFLLVYNTEAEKSFWMQKLDIDGTKIMYTVDDFEV